MRVLLIGPYPPPHGGISVHVAGIQQKLVASGVTCRVLDTSRVRPGLGFILTVLRHAFTGWTIHFHTNGHNVKSWLLALGCGLGGQFHGGSILTLHSGMVPGYLEESPFWRRGLAAFTCSLYRHVICVSHELRGALVSLGVEPRDLEVLPAFLGTERPECSEYYKTLKSPQTPTVLWGASRGPHPTGWSFCSDGRRTGPGGPARTRASAPLFPCGQDCPPHIQEWIARHRPLFSTVLFFRPEYGFDLLVAACARMKHLYPSLGCLVMGSGEQQADAEKLISHVGLEDNILLLGDVDHAACLSLMSVCDVFLRPTLEDGDSISVREALSLGIPVVASRAGARPAAAILFRPGDVEEMLAKIDLALVSKRGIQSSAGGLAAGTCMDRLLEIYRHVDGSEGSLCLN